MLSNLWQLIREDRTDKESAKYRRLEAEMGYDPDECPEELMNKALALEKKMGTAALSELAPVYGKSAIQTPLAAIEEIADSPWADRSADSHHPVLRHPPKVRLGSVPSLLREHCARRSVIRTT